jgi:biotin-(acetyl-CoA carboxylase) ligase
VIVRRWQELSSYARGKQVTVTLDDRQVSGETAGITETGALLLRTPAGELRTMLAGEVSRLRRSDE